MSMKHAIPVWDYELDKTTAWLLFAICDSINEQSGLMYASHAFLSWKSGLGESTVYSIMAWMESNHILTYVGKHGRYNAYTVDLSPLPLKVPWVTPPLGRPPRAPRVKPDENTSTRERVLSSENTSTRERVLRENTSTREKSTSTREKSTSTREKRKRYSKPTAAQAAPGLGQATLAPEHIKEYELYNEQEIRACAREDVHTQTVDITTNPTREAATQESPREQPAEYSAAPGRWEHMQRWSKLAEGVAYLSTRRIALTPGGYALRTSDLMTAYRAWCKERHIACSV